MIIKQIQNKKELRQFYEIYNIIYKKYQCMRKTEESVIKLIINGPTAFHKHAKVIPCLLLKDGNVEGRFAFIYDKNLSEYLQISFFEAIPGLDNIVNDIKTTAKELFPEVSKFVVGLNGHLNYSAGILLDNYDKPPVFGLPYNPPYYPLYFKNLTERKMVSYRFKNDLFFRLYEKKINKTDLKGITVREINKKRITDEIKIYTYLNNACFKNHPYWSDRTVEEDLELFYPFRFLLNNDNLLFAEYDNKPVGFLLWYPDFNELVDNQNKDIGLFQLMKYNFANPIDTFRFTEISVLPEFRNKPVTFALILKLIEAVKKTKYKTGEGGFIFLENTASKNMTERFLKRATFSDFKPSRSYALYEGSLR
ncbi:MAG: GNAT family N-acetyltransferase [Spirochaetes bacterium]|nr:GNAT family N-acetyltransferase [Spirochaetota bacterium]